MFSKHRLEALSDGIFAVAMTLLVLDLIPHTDIPPGQLGAVLAHNGAAWSGVILTFGISAVFWTLQHRVFDLIDDICPATIIPTFIFLGLIAILPFTAAILGHHVSDHLASMLYFGNYFGIALALTAKLEIARASGHLRPHADALQVRLRLYAMCLIGAGCLIAALYLPLTRFWIAPVALGFLTRIAHRLYNKRLAKKAAPKAKIEPV